MKDIRVGFIGLGGRGQGLLEWVVLAQGEQVAAVCDVYEDRAQKAPSWWRKPDKTGLRPIWTIAM